MDTHSIVVFVHVLGAAALFAALGVEVTALGPLRRAATVGEARAWLRALSMPGRLAGPVMLATVVSGAALSAMAWGFAPWTLAALAAVVPMGVAGGGVTGRAMRRVAAALRGHPDAAEVPPAARALLAGPALPSSFRLRLALAVGVVALMTLKPGWTGAAGVLAVSVTGGLLAAARARGAGVERPRRGEGAPGEAAAGGLAAGRDAG
jgi:hypothetical protein